MIKVSHETPLSLLEISRFFNDYDYALVNIFERNKKYFDFFKTSLEMGREVILDNSLYELGSSFDSEKYIHWIDQLRPTYCVVPDAFDDAQKTKRMFNEFMSLVDATAKFQLPKRIAVVHGRSYEEYKDVYIHFNNCLKSDEIIAFTAGDPFTGKHNGFQRYLVIQKLWEEGIINSKRKHHLLGCYLPQEFSLYTWMGFITSIDTSSPVTATIERTPFTDFGLSIKPHTKINEIFESSIQIDLNLLKFNLDKFRELVKRQEVDF